MFGEPALYDFRPLSRHGLLVHTPGPISDIKESSQGVSFRVNGWPRPPWYVLINGFSTRPTVKLSGVETPVQGPHQYQEPEGRLILRLNGPTDIELVLPTKDALRIRRRSADGVKVGRCLEAANYVLGRATLPMAGSAARSKALFAVATEVTRLIFPRKSPMIREPPCAGCHFFNHVLGREPLDDPIGTESGQRTYKTAAGKAAEFFRLRHGAD